MSDSKPAEPALPQAAQQAAMPPGKARRPFLFLGAAAVATLLCIGAYLFFTRGREATDDAQVEADVVPIAARVAGQVQHARAIENQGVKRGDLIVELDPADYQARVDAAQAELDTADAQAAAAEAQALVIAATARGGLSSARAQVSGSSVGVESARAQVAAARAGLVRAEAEARKAETDLRRTQELRNANVLAQERLDAVQAQADEARAALDQAKAQLAAAEEQAHLAVSRVGEAQGSLERSRPVAPQIAAAQANARLAHARVKTAAAQLALARLQLSYTRVLAPEDGLVSRLSVHEGQLVQAGQPIAELVPPRTYVVANFKETQITEMRPGQRAKVLVDAFPGHDLEARVESLAGGTGARFSLLPPDNASGNFVKVVQRVPVRLAWTRPPEVPLRAGLSADVTVYVGERPAAPSEGQPAASR